MSWGLGVGSRSKGGRKGLAPAPSVTRWSAGGGRESHRPKRHTFQGENLENLVPPLTAWSRVSRAAGASVSPFVKRCGQPSSPPRTYRKCQRPGQRHRGARARTGSRGGLARRRAHHSPATLEGSLAPSQTPNIPAP